MRTGREQSLEAGAGVVEFQSTGFSRSESCQEPGRGFCSECAGTDIKQVAFERERQAREIDVLNLLLVVATVDNEKTTEDPELVHRGISQRKFSRTWSMADDAVVQEAKMEQGMLYVKIERVVPDEKKPKLIKIS